MSHGTLWCECHNVLTVINVEFSYVGDGQKRIAFHHVQNHWWWCFLTEQINPVLHYEQVVLPVSEAPASWPPRPALTLPRMGCLSSRVVGKMVSQWLFSKGNTNHFKRVNEPYMNGLCFLFGGNHFRFPKFTVVYFRVDIFIFVWETLVKKKTQIGNNLTAKIL